MTRLGALSRPALWVVILLLFPAAILAQAKESSRPSVLLIVMDTVRADHLGSYGYPRDITPSLDALVTDAARFTSAFTVMPHTLPAHLSLFTSRYPRELGVLSNGQVYDGEVPLLAEILTEHGYRTGAFVSGLPVHSKFGLGHGFGTYKNGTGWRTPGDVAYENFASWLEEPSTAPFFAWVHLYDAHIPYAPPQGPTPLAIDEALRTWVTGKQISIDPLWGPIINETTIRKFATHGEKDPFLHNLNEYAAEIRHADSIVGKILDLLKKKGIFQSTLIIVLSDHGEGLGEHGYYFHGLYLFEEQLQIPLIIRLPGGTGSGMVSEETASLLDITPTILETVGIPDDVMRRGASLLPVLHGQKKKRSGNRVLFSESRAYGPNSPRVAQSISSVRRHGLRDTRWKFILTTDGDMELYDLLADPEERVNLAGREEKVARKLHGDLTAWLKEIPQGKAPGSGPLDEEDKEHLRSLGYADPTK